MYLNGDILMYVIMTYDVGVKRVTKVLKIGRKYLTHVQNSVLEGELSPKRFKDLKKEVKKVIEDDHDAVTFYKMQRATYLKKEMIGIVSDEPIEFI